MSAISNSEVKIWLEKKKLTNLLLVLKVTFSGLSSSVFRLAKTGELITVENGSRKEQTGALKRFSNAVGRNPSEDPARRSQIESALISVGSAARRAYFAYEQSGRKINQKFQVGDGTMISAEDIYKAYEENAKDIFEDFVERTLKFTDEQSLRDETGFGILLTGECAGMPPVEYAVRKAFSISPFIPSPVIDMYGGVEPDIRDREELRRALAGSQRLSVNSKGIYYIADDGTVKAVCFGTKKMPARGRAVSAGERHVVFVDENGSCTAIGDNSMGECSLNGTGDCGTAYASGDATYLVRENGTVSSCGTTPLGRETDTWKHIKMLAGNRGFVVGLRTDGTVLCAKENWLKNSFEDIKDWKDVTNIAAASGCIAALGKDGTVMCSCTDPRDKRNTCILFKDLVGIAADSRYVYGLTRDGKVLLAGDGSSLTDMGRSEASKWNGVLAIAAGNACVAGICEDGRVLSAGNITLPPGWNGTFQTGSVSSADKPYKIIHS